MWLCKPGVYGSLDSLAQKRDHFLGFDPAGIQVGFPRFLEVYEIRKSRNLEGLTHLSILTTKLSSLIPIDFSNLRVLHHLSLEFLKLNQALFLKISNELVFISFGNSVHYLPRIQ